MITKKDLIECEIKNVRQCVVLEKSRDNDKMTIKNFNIALKNLFNALYIENKLCEVV